MKKEELVHALVQHAKTERASPPQRKRPRQAVGLPLAGGTVSGADQDEAGRGQRPDVPQRCRQGRLRQGPPGRHGPRSLLAARLLGTQPEERRTGEGRPGAVLARRPAGLAAVRGASRRHDHFQPAADPRRGNPRRREQLVHRRLQSPEDLSTRHRLSGGGGQVLLPGAEQRGEHACRGRRRRLRPELGRRGQGFRSDFRPKRRL